MSTYESKRLRDAPHVGLDGGSACALDIATKR